DPIGFAAHDSNLYRYLANDPTALTDPTGQAALLGYIPLLTQGKYTFITRETEGYAKWRMVHWKMILTFTAFPGFAGLYLFAKLKFIFQNSFLPMPIGLGTPPGIIDQGQFHGGEVDAGDQYEELNIPLQLRVICSQRGWLSAGGSGTRLNKQ